MKKSWSRNSLMCVGLVGVAASLWGQAGSGELTGHVTDPSGNPVLGALVTAESESNQLKQQTVTTSSGDFLFLNQQSARIRLLFPSTNSNG